MSVLISPYTQPSHTRPWEQPLSDAILAQGFQAQENYNKQLQQNFTNTANSFLNIQAMSPQDEVVLSQKKKEFMEDMGKISIDNLKDPKTNNQIQQTIEKWRNDPDLMGIAQKSAVYRAEQQKKKEYEEKGKTYVSPALRQAQNYIESGIYDANTRFNKQGFVAPDDKELDEIAKNTPEWETWSKEGGYDINKKGKAIGTLANNYYTHFKTNPQWSQLLDDQFDQQIEGYDLNSYLENPKEAIAQLFPHLPPEDQPYAEEVFKELNAMKDNPYAESSIRQNLRNLFYQDQAILAAKAKTYSNIAGMKADEFSVKAKEHEYRMQEINERKTTNATKALQEMLPSVRTYFNALIKAGVPVDQLFDDNGKPKDINDLPDIPEKKKAQADYNKDLGVKTVKNLISVLKQGVITTTHQAELESIIKNRKIELGLTNDATPENIRFEDGKIKFTNTKGWNTDYEFTPEELESKLGVSGNELPTINSIEEYNKLAPGTKYKDSKGNTATKK